MKSTLQAGNWPEVKDAHDEKVRTSLQHAKVQEEASKAFAKLAVESNLGRGAMIQHVHSRAGAGKLMNIVVVSRVINAFVGATGNPMLRLHVGKRDGTLSSGLFGQLYPVDIIDIVEPSSEPFI